MKYENFMFISGLVTGLFIGFFGAAIGIKSYMNDLKAEACKRGYASWVVTNPRTGHAVFQWNPITNEKETK